MAFLKSKHALDRIKEHYSILLGTEMFRDDGLHLPQTHLPRVNENSSVEHLKHVEELKKHNANIKEYNDLVDKLISANRPQTITAEQYNNTSKIGNEINEALEKARLKTDASRACLVQFHNGRT